MTPDAYCARHADTIPDACSFRPQRASTLAVHAAERRLKPERALVEPVFHTSTYTFDNMADACRYQEAHNQGHVDGRFEYGRYGNPTVAAAEARLAALEGAESAIQVASGMAALTYTSVAMAEVRKIMDQAKDGGGFLLIPTAGPINVPLSPKTEANYRAFIDAGLEFGRY